MPPSGKAPQAAAALYKRKFLNQFIIIVFHNRFVNKKKREICRFISIVTTKDTNLLRDTSPRDKE